MFDYEGRKVIQHGGGLPGFHSKLVIVPEENLGYVILANQLSGLVESVYKTILDFYLADSIADWTSIYYENEQAGKERQRMKEEQRMASRKTETSPGHVLSAYAGTYEDKMYGKAKISQRGETLSVVLEPSEKLFFGDLEHWEDETFRFTFNDPFLPPGYITFHGDEDGSVGRFTIDLENPDFHFFKLNFEKID
jgi:hypothetical protein